MIDPCRLALLFTGSMLLSHLPQSSTPATPAGVVEALAATADETGLSDLKARLSGAVPTGAGERVALAEPFTTGYMPDVADPDFAGKTLVTKSGPSGASTHATAVAKQYFGLSTSVSPGIADARCYSLNDFLGNGFLRSSAPINAPKTVNWRVQNNSWQAVGDNGYLLKYDYAIEEQDLFVASAVTDGTGPLDVSLFSHLYNGVAVGVSDGSHRAGGTLFGFGTPGRQKPELVAPASATSFSTPLVAGSAALLLETAKTHPLLALNPNAQQPEVIKAVLMAGAEHRSGWSNNPAATGPDRGATATPLDPLYGADELDVNNAHWVLTGGEQVASTSVAGAPPARHNGWSLAAVNASESRFWRFDVEAAKPHVSVLATWNRSVDPAFTDYSEPAIDMELWRVDSTGALVSLVGDGGLPYFAAGNVLSESPVDNLEHIYATDLAPGEYALEIRRGADGVALSFDVAVAWELKCVEPFTYGVGKLTSSGKLPYLEVRGVPSAAENDFDLSIRDAEPNKNGLIFYGVGQKSTPFFGGTLLVQGPLKRLPVVTTDANGDYILPISIDASMIGEQRNYQFWFRDPTHPDGTTVGLTNAAEMVFCP